MDGKGWPEEEEPLSITFEELFERYETKIFNLIYRTIGDYEDAADLTSETFLHAFRSFQRFRGESQPYTWLYRIAVNLCKNYFRKRSRQERVQIESLDRPGWEEDREHEIADFSQAPDRLYEAAELQRYVQECIDSLPADFRLVVVLRDLQGLSYKEIAEAVGCSVEAVKSRLFRARSLLRKMLAPYIGAEA